MRKDAAVSVHTVYFNLLILAAVAGRFFNSAASEQSGFAYAYLDPGTGSMIISAIVGVFATIILGIKTVGYKLKNLFRPRRKNGDGTPGAK
jgi:hypothetical protein